MKNTLSFTLRIDEDLMAEFKKLCQKERRSANSQIIYLIEQYIDEADKES